MSNKKCNYLYFPVILCINLKSNPLELTALRIIWRNAYSFFKELVLLVSSFSFCSNAFFVLYQDSNWYQTWPDPHFLSEWISQCCPDGEGEICACLFAPTASFFKLFSPALPIVLSNTSLLHFHLASLLFLLILPQNFCLKGLLSDNSKQRIHFHPHSKLGHMIIILLFPSLSLNSYCVRTWM